MSQKNPQKLWRAYFALAALEAGAAFVVLITIPREGSDYSTARSMVLASLACVALLATVFSMRVPSWATEPVEGLQSPAALPWLLDSPQPSSCSVILIQHHYCRTTSGSAYCFGMSS